MLNPSSKLKGEKDMMKYEKARQLKQMISKGSRLLETLLVDLQWVFCWDVPVDLLIVKWSRSSCKIQIQYLEHCWCSWSCKNKESRSMFIQRFSSTRLQSFKDEALGTSPGWWTNTVATYCPSRPSQILANNRNITLRQSGWIALYLQLNKSANGNINKKFEPHPRSGTTTRPSSSRRRCASGSGRWRSTSSTSWRWGRATRRTRTRQTPSAAARSGSSTSRCTMRRTVSDGWDTRSFFIRGNGKIQLVLPLKK